MRKTYLITLLLCCFSALLNGAVSPFSFSSLKMEEGLSQLSVLKIHQDKSGFMWFATRNGLIVMTVILLSCINIVMATH